MKIIKLVGGSWHGKSMEVDELMEILHIPLAPRDSSLLFISTEGPLIMSYGQIETYRQVRVLESGTYIFLHEELTDSAEALLTECLDRL